MILSAAIPVAVLLRGCHVKYAYRTVAINQLTRNNSYSNAASLCTRFAIMNRTVDNALMRSLLSLGVSLLY